MTDDWGVLDDCGICPVCRRVNRHDRPCDLDGAVVRSIGSVEDKQFLIDAIWGPSASRDESTQSLRPRKESLGSAVVAGALELLFGLVGTMVAAARTKRYGILIPSGGTQIPKLPRFAAGKILPCETVVAPGSGTECAAWAIELRYDGSWGSRITLRVGASAGFVVALDAGEYVKVPPGPLSVHDALPQLSDLEAPSLEDLLRALDPTRTGDTEAWPLFPYNIVGEQTFLAGDRIELLGAMDRALVADQLDAMYREAPASVLVPCAIPTLRRVASR